MKELLKRTFFTLIFGSLTFLIIYFSHIRYAHFFVAAIIFFIAICAIYEFFFILEKKKIKSSSSILIVGALFQILVSILQFQFLSLLVISIVFALIFLTNFKKIDGAIVNIATNYFCYLYLVVPLSFLFAILYNPYQDGRIWLAYLILVTKASDIGGYFGGKLFGKSKLAPKISPKKTKIGSVFGFVLAMIVSLLFYPWMGLITSIVLGILLAVFAQIGDLAESLIKRDTNVKDSNKLPAIGGVLDIFDSLIFNIVIIYLFLLI